MASRRYLEEWVEADEAAQVVGWSAVSLLGDTLKLYFNALEQQLEFKLSADGKTIAKRAGFVAAYRGSDRRNSRHGLGRLSSALRCDVVDHRQ
ncbi:hypothetical protein HFO91_34395 [Rhizobium leguminosarum]|nr:hypothetical protein [Rhizobium leguminosarum]